MPGQTLRRRLMADIGKELTEVLRLLAEEAEEWDQLRNPKASACILHCALAVGVAAVRGRDVRFVRQHLASEKVDADSLRVCFNKNPARGDEAVVHFNNAMRMMINQLAK